MILRKQLSRPFLPYGSHLIGNDDIDAVIDTLRSDRLTTGPCIEAFETAFAEKTGAAHAVVCSSGTAALHLAALNLALEPDDWVVVPSITFVATANAIRFVGGEVAFADVDPDTGLMTTASLEQTIQSLPKAPKAVINVYLAGQCDEPADIYHLTAAVGAQVIEDACHALGTTYEYGIDGETLQATVGSCRHAQQSVFSFHPVKTIAAGEGGAVTTNDEAVAQRAKMLRNHGLTHDATNFQHRNHAFDLAGNPNRWYYEMHDLGFNYRASDIHCALGLSQLKKLDNFVETRRRLTVRYHNGLEELAPTLRPIRVESNSCTAWHLLVVLIEFNEIRLTRNRLMNELAERGIGTQVHYIPVHSQPYYVNRYGEQQRPGAKRYYERALSLPLHPAMTEEDVDYVTSTLKDLLN